MPASPASPASPALSPRRLFTVAIAAAVAGLALMLSFGYADHAPKPHHVRIAVSAPAAVVSRLAAGLDQQAPGAFTLVSVPGAGAATHSVRSQSAAGALIVPAAGANMIVTAAAEGTLQQQVITQALAAASSAMHRAVTSADVAPLTPGDASGLSAFVFGLGLLVPSVIASVGLFLLGARLRLWWRVGSAAVFALLVSLGGALAMDSIFGALPGGVSLIAVGFIGALSFVLTIAALQAVVGLPGTAVGALAFIFLGNAISGGSVPTAFLPDGFRQIAPWLPNNAIVRAVRDVVYFGGHDLGHPLLVLGIWPVAALLVLGAVDALHRAERRVGSDDASQIYNTSAIAHVKIRRARRLAARSTPASSKVAISA
jgi:hypothetical protein